MVKDLMEHFDVSKRAVKFLDRRQIYLRRPAGDSADDEGVALEEDGAARNHPLQPDLDESLFGSVTDELSRKLRDGSVESELRVVCRHLLGMYHATVPPVASVGSNRRVYVASRGGAGAGLQENDYGENLFECESFLRKAKKRHRFGSIALVHLLKEFSHPSQVSAILWLLFGPTTGVEGEVLFSLLTIEMSEGMYPSQNA
jgi:hypothetical protein